MVKALDADVLMHLAALICGLGAVRRACAVLHLSGTGEGFPWDISTQGTCLAK
jgi:hypothetical protein